MILKDAKWSLLISLAETDFASYMDPPRAGWLASSDKNEQRKAVV